MPAWDPDLYIWTSMPQNLFDFLHRVSWLPASGARDQPWSCIERRLANMMRLLMVGLRSSKDRVFRDKSCVTA